MTDERNDIDIRLIDYYLDDEDSSSKGITAEKVWESSPENQQLSPSF